MRTLRKNVALLISALLLLAVATIGIVSMPVHASTLDEFVANLNQDLDFQNTWGQSGLSVDLIEGDKVLYRAQYPDDKSFGWGWRVTNNYRQRLDGATFDADVYMMGVGNIPVIYYGINPSGGSGGEYWDFGGLGVYMSEKSETELQVQVGWWKMNYGLIGSTTDPKYTETNGITLYGEKTVTVTGGKVNVKSVLAQNEDESWKMTLTIDGGDPWEIPISKELWEKNSNNTTGFLGFAHLMNTTGVEYTAAKMVMNSYGDKNRTAYLQNEDLEAEFTALNGIKTAYDTAKAMTQKPTLSQASDILYTVTANKDIVVSNEDVRRMEMARATWYYEQTRALFDKLYADDKAAYDVVSIGVSVNYFAEKAAKIKTERDVESVEKLKKDVDYDTLDSLVDEGMEGVDALVDKYNVADGQLADAKDGFVVEHLEEYEAACNDLDTNDKIKAAAELQKAVIINNAKRANREAYTARYNAATALLKAKISGYAGDLAKKWDIHNVTFVQSNKYGEIKYSASDYYDNDSSTDVGITLKQKLALDGLSFEFTVNSGDYDPDSWFGFFFTKERTVFVSASEASTGLNESRGIITLVKPYAADDKAGTAAFTRIRMGYPNLYGHETMNIPQADCDLYKNTFKFEFEKGTIEDGGEEVDVYNAYVTVTDADEKVIVERKLVTSMIASVLEEELGENAEGYLTFGSCDKTLCGVEATITSINDTPAANFGAVIDDDPEKPDPDKPNGGETNSDGGKKKGCGSVAGGGDFAVISLGLLLAVSGAMAVRRRRSAK